MNWGTLASSAPAWCLRRTAKAVLAAIPLTLPLALISAPAQAQTASTTGTAIATVVTPLSVVLVQNMSFGRIVARPQPGTVTVDQITGQCIVTGPILEVGQCRYAQFAGMGGRNMNARISLTSVSNLTGPGQTMVLDNITLGTNSTISFSGNPNANGRGVGLTQGQGNQRYQIASNSGIFVLNIGGRLNVNANQAPGVYTGSITINIQYQ